MATTNKQEKLPLITNIISIIVFLAGVITFVWASSADYHDRVTSEEVKKIVAEEVKPISKEVEMISKYVNLLYEKEILGSNSRERHETP